jgi:hypothetical protein
MQDLNIRLLLHRIWETWSRSAYERNRPRSYVFLPRAGRAQEAVLNSWGISVLTSDQSDPGKALSEFMGQLSERVDQLRGEDEEA